MLISQLDNNYYSAQGKTSLVDSSVTSSYNDDELVYDSGKIDLAINNLETIKTNLERQINDILTGVDKCFDTISSQKPYNSVFSEDDKSNNTDYKNKLTYLFNQSKNKIIELRDAYIRYNKGEYTENDLELINKYIDYRKKPKIKSVDTGGMDEEIPKLGNDEVHNNSKEELEQLDDNNSNDDNVNKDNDTSSNNDKDLPEDNNSNDNDLSKNNDGINYAEKDPVIIPNNFSKPISKPEEEKFKFLNNIEDLLNDNVADNLYDEDNLIIPTDIYNSKNIKTKKGGVNSALVLGLAAGAAGLGGKIAFDKNKSSDDELLLEDVDDNYDGEREEEDNLEEEQDKENKKVEEKTSSEFLDNDSFFNDNTVDFKNNLFLESDGDK